MSYKFTPIPHPDLEIYHDINCFELREGHVDIPNVPNVRPGDYFVLVEKDNKKVALINYSYINTSVLNIHCNVLPEYRASDATAIAKEFINKLKDIGTFTKIVTMVPANAIHSKIFVKRLGFTQEGNIEKSYMYNGKLEDLLIMSYSLREVA